MSADQVDDIEHAEDRMHSAEAKLRELLSGTAGDINNATLMQLRRSAAEVLDAAVGYCRPTCGADGEPAGVVCDESCGCPCHDC